MNFLEFLSLNKKEQKKLLNDAGIGSYRDAALATYIAFKTKMNLDRMPEGISIPNWHSVIYKGSCQEVSFVIRRGPDEIGMRWWIQGSPTKSVGCGIDKFSPLKMFYKKCDLYDVRGDYNNLEFSIDRHVLDILLNCDCRGNVGDFINLYFNMVDEFKPICEKVAKICTDGSFEMIASKLNGAEIKRGHIGMYDSNLIYFVHAVDALYNINKIILKDTPYQPFGYIDVAYLWKAFQSNLPGAEKLTPLFEQNAFCNHSLLDDIDPKLLIGLIIKVQSFIRKPVYGQVVYNAFVEYTEKCKEIAEQVKRKYELNANFDFSKHFFDPERGPIQFSYIEVPENLKETFR